MSCNRWQPMLHREAIHVPSHTAINEASSTIHECIH
uniref:Uncharacterized protein n=1 Tax=Rhizophora mucronata TaxID=61149 RepID=A0A2P2J3V2_RHIMU